jgi:hypothetical protein
VANGGNRRGFAQRLREARQSYPTGPFSAALICEVLEADGYKALDAAEDEFLVYVKEGCKAVPVNRGWPEIWADDPIFRATRRSIGISQKEMLMRLNRASQ